MTGIKFTKMFFDRKAVTDAVDKATRKILSKFGAFVRTSARSSIRQAKGPSRPGMPPHSHSGLLKNFIFFGYDRLQKSVVIGPERLTGKNMGDAPDVLEHGGKAIIKGYPLSASQRKKYPNGKKIIIKARPTMNPALAKNIDMLPPMWRNSVSPA